VKSGPDVSEQKAAFNTSVDGSSETSVHIHPTAQSHILTQPLQVYDRVYNWQLLS